MPNRLEELLPLLARLAEVDGEFKSLADLAAADGRSPFHLQRIFKAEVGESPLQFSRRVRLQRAAASLLVTEKSVLEVALDAGFEGPESFSRAFRKSVGLAPIKFRGQRGRFYELVRHHQVHLETAFRTAPCVGLYRRSVTEKQESSSPKGEEPMSYEVTKKQSPETPFLFIRRQVQPEALAEALASMLPAVFQHITAEGLAFAGPPTTRYVSFGPGLITLEAGIPVAGAAEGKGEIQLGSLVAGPVATTIHKGPYDSLNLAHEAVQSWIAEQAEESSGAPWEVYLTDPGEVPDPADWLTEVNWPLA